MRRRCYRRLEGFVNEPSMTRGELPSGLIKQREESAVVIRDRALFSCGKGSRRKAPLKLGSAIRAELGIGLNFRIAGWALALHRLPAFGAELRPRLHLRVARRALDRRRGRGLLRSAAVRAEPGADGISGAAFGAGGRLRLVARALLRTLAAHGPGHHLAVAHAES